MINMVEFCNALSILTSVLRFAMIIVLLKHQNESKLFQVLHLNWVECLKNVEAAFFSNSKTDPQPYSDSTTAMFDIWFIGLKKKLCLINSNMAFLCDQIRYFFSFPNACPCEQLEFPPKLELFDLASISF